MNQRAALAVGGIILLTAGIVDALVRQRLGLPVDFIFIAAGAGALGIHITLP